MPAKLKPESSAIVVVRDLDLAGSLELALTAGGFNAFIFDPAQGLDRLPIDIAMTLIVEDEILKPDPAAFVASLRARPWNGLVILVTGRAWMLGPLLERSDRIAVLEMPFIGADLLAAIRAVWPAEPDAS